MTKRFSFPLVLLAVFSGVSLSARLRESDIQIEVARMPATAAIRVETKVESGRHDAEIVAVKITNTSKENLALTEIKASVPWLKSDGANFALISGGWDMGRTEARVHAPSDSDISSGAYLMARKSGGGYALAGFTTWHVFNSKMTYAEGALALTADGEGRVLKPGETVALEKISLTSGDNWQDLLFGYADDIASENHIHLNKPKAYTGWATWDYYGRNWTAQTVTDNLDALQKVYPKADMVQIDGGWWPQRGDYLQVRDSLQPDGMKRLAKIIRDHGLIAGIHFDGMRGDAKAQVAKEHPEYFLKDGKGAMLVQQTMNVGENLDYTFFDFSNPGACDYMRSVTKNIRSNWGFDYIKIDFLRFGINEFIAPAVSKKGPAEIVPFDRSLTSLERFHRGMSAFREGMGKDAYFLACSAVFGPVYGHADGLRTGADINPQFKQYKKCAVDNSGNFYLHGKVVYNDSDYHVVRGKEDQDSTRVKAGNKDGSKTTLNEAEMWTHYEALFGGPKLNSDNLTILREERRDLFRLAASIPTSERYVPLDLWNHAKDDEDPSSAILGVHGDTVYLGVFNWTDDAKDIRLDGFKPADLKDLNKLGGSGAVQIAGDSLTVGLPARHSTIFSIKGADFDRLRKALQVR